MRSTSPLILVLAASFVLVNMSQATVAPKLTSLNKVWIILECYYGHDTIAMKNVYTLVLVNGI